MNIYTHAVPAALREANSKVVNLVLPAQVARELNAPLSSLANLQLTVRKGNIGRGGGDRKLNLLSQVLSCQRRSTAALFSIGVRWCQISLITGDAEIVAEGERFLGSAWVVQTSCRI
jgi:hypothetical protein